MRLIHALILIFSLPLLLAIAHDMYIFYLNEFAEIQLSDLGFIWTKYHPESFKMAAQELDPALWSNIRQILPIKAVIIGAVFAGLMYTILFLLSLLGMFKSKKHFQSANRLKNMLGRQHDTLSKF